MDNLLAITNIAEAAPRAPLVLRGDPLDALRQAAELGYQALEIHVIDPRTFPGKEVRQLCEKLGLRISAIVTGQIFTRRKLCITSPDPENRTAAMAEVRQYIDIAAEVNATDGIVIGWVKGNRPEENADAFDRLLAGQLTELGLYARERGQKILVEVINRYETNLFNTARELKEYILRWELPNCYIHMDTFHMNIEEADMAQSILECGELLGYFHIADSNRLHPGAGHTDFIPVFRSLKQVGYRGAISLECIPEPDSLTAAVTGRQKITEYLEKA